MRAWQREKVVAWRSANAMSSKRAAVSLAIVNLSLLILVAGCAHVPNQWREDGPSVSAEWDSPTAADVYARFEPAPPRYRDWEVASVATENGAVTHWPLYFEDPFEDKGAGRSEYRLGWEDYLAMPYCYSRYTLNWLLLPVSAIVTPPWTLMESDGVLSRQALGYDHDATRAEHPVPEAPPAAKAPAATNQGEDTGHDTPSGDQPADTP